MTVQFRPFQHDLFQRIANQPSGSALHVVAPSGAGVATVLAEAAARIVDGGSDVLVVSDRVELSHQWAMLLARAGIVDVRLVARTSDAIRIADGRSDDDPSSSPHATVVGWQAMRHRAGRRVIAAEVPSLLIFDLTQVYSIVDVEELESLGSLLGRSGRSVVRTLDGEAPSWLPRTEQLRISLSDVVGGAASSLGVVRFELSAVETEVLNSASEFISTFSEVRFGWNTRPACYGTLLRMASWHGVDGSAQGETSQLREPRTPLSRDEAERAWDLIDRIDALGDDPRLGCLSDVVLAPTAQGPTYVLARRVDEVEYLASHLESTFEQVLTISGSMPESERRAAITESGTGTAVAATPASLKGFELPRESSVTWWTGPFSAAEAAVVLRRTGRATTLVSSPPLLDDQRVLEVVEQLRADLPPGALTIRSTGAS